MLKSAVLSSPYFTLNHHGPSCMGVSQCSPYAPQCVARSCGVCSVEGSQRQERAKSIPACGSWATLSTVGRTPSASPPVGAGAGAALGAMRLCSAGRSGRVETRNRCEGRNLPAVNSLIADTPAYLLLRLRPTSHSRRREHSTQIRRKPCAKACLHGSPRCRSSSALGTCACSLSAQRAAATKPQRAEVKLVTCAQLSEAGS